MCGLLPACRRTSRRRFTARNDHSFIDHLAFPMFLRGLSPDLVHIPLNRVPLLMIKPYVVTIHDMANLFFEEEEHSGFACRCGVSAFAAGWCGPTA